VSSRGKGQNRLEKGGKDTKGRGVTGNRRFRGHRPEKGGNLSNRESNEGAHSGGTLKTGFKKNVVRSERGVAGVQPQV